MKKSAMYASCLNYVAIIWAQNITEYCKMLTKQIYSNPYFCNWNLLSIKRHLILCQLKDFSLILKRRGICIMNMYEAKFLEINSMFYILFQRKRYTNYRSCLKILLSSSKISQQIQNNIVYCNIDFILSNCLI